MILPGPPCPMPGTRGQHSTRTIVGHVGLACWRCSRTWRFVPDDGAPQYSILRESWIAHGHAQPTAPEWHPVRQDGTLVAWLCLTSLDVLRITP